MIYLDPKKLESRGIAPTDVVRALDEGNFIASPGSVYIGDNQIALDSNVLLAEVADFNDLPIRIGPDVQVLLKDIGHAEDAYYIQKSRVRVNGRRQVFVPVYRQSGASSLSVAEGVTTELPKIQKAETPEGTKLEFVMDQTESVRKAIDSLIHEGVIGDSGGGYDPALPRRLEDDDHRGDRAPAGGVVRDRRPVVERQHPSMS